MRKVMFDLLFSQPLDGSKFHGGGEYIKRVFLKLVKEHYDEVHIIAFYNYEEFLDDWLKKLIVEYKIETVDIKNIAELPAYFENTKIDVFYTGLPYEYSKELLPEKVYKIATFHGMRATECPHDQYEYKFADTALKKIKAYLHYFLRETPVGYSRDRRNSILQYKKCIDTFDQLVCDSEHSKFSILNYFPVIESDDIQVCYCPMKVSSPSIDLTNKCDEKGKYILIVSANRWIKNAYRGIIAIDDLYERGHLVGVKTIVVGKLPASIKQEIKHPESFEHYGYVETDELESLYKNCSVFLYVTLNEGFGYPPLEAMHYGRTCVVSSICSLPEVCGNAVYYVNPYDIGEIQNRLLQSVQKPINENCVKQQFEKVRKRQDEDLEKLCELLVKGRKEIRSSYEIPCSKS